MAEEKKYYYYKKSKQDTVITEYLEVVLLDISHKESDNE